MSRSLSRLAATFAAAVSLFSTAPAQRQPQVVVPTPSPMVLPLQQEQSSMLYTPNGLYVLRGDKVFRLDLNTLQVLAVQELPKNTRATGRRRRGAGRAVAEVEPPTEQIELVDVTEEVVEEEEPEEEPVLVDRAVADPKPQAMRQLVDDAIDWLVAHQDADGKWDADQFMKHDIDGEPCDGAGQPTHDIGATGLAMLALLGDGNSLRTGPHKAAVKRAATWLRAQQDQKTGLFGVAAAHDFIYDHAIASLAMVECYGLSNYKVLRKSAQLGINYLEYHRNPYGVWRYQPRDGDNDTSVTTWAVMAYRAAADFGLEVNEQALELAANWYDAMTDPATARTGYSERGGMSSRLAGDHAVKFPRNKNEAMTAASLFARYLIDANGSNQQLLGRQAALVASKPPVWDPNNGSIDAVGWMWAAYGLFQHGGEHWDAYHRQLSAALTAGQRTDGAARGSFDPSGSWGSTGGRVYMTALMALSAEASYRYGRLRKQD